MFGPVLRGAKVTLRALTKEDLPNFVRWFADTEVTSYLATRFPFSMQHEEEWFARLGEDRDNIVWAIEVDGAHLGSVGVHRVDWVNGTAMTGTIIGEKRHWGQGIASEAVGLRTRFAFRELNLHKLNSETFLENRAMHRVLEKAGYRRVGVLRHEYWREGAWRDTLLWEVLRADWERAHAQPRT